MRMPLDGDADHLAAIGDEHDLVGLLDREGGDQRAVSLVDDHGDDAFAAAAGDAVFERRGPLAVAALGDGEHELLGGAHLRIALLRAARLDRLLPPPRRSTPFSSGLRSRRGRRATASDKRARSAGARLEMAQDRHRDHAVARARAICRARRPNCGPSKTRTSVDREADALAAARWSAARRRRRCRSPRRRSPSPSSELHGDLAVALHVDEVGELVAPHRPARRREHQVRCAQLASSSGSGRIEVMRSPCSSGSRLTSALPRPCGAASGSRHTFIL